MKTDRKYQILTCSEAKQLAQTVDRTNERIYIDDLEVLAARSENYALLDNATGHKRYRLSIETAQDKEMRQVVLFQNQWIGTVDWGIPNKLFAHWNEWTSVEIKDLDKIAQIQMILPKPSHVAGLSWGPIVLFAVMRMLLEHWLGCFGVHPVATEAYLKKSDSESPYLEKMGWSKALGGNDYVTRWVKSLHDTDS